jgi:hypothetical protein
MHISCTVGGITGSAVVYLKVKLDFIACIEKQMMFISLKFLSADIAGSEFPSIQSLHRSLKHVFFVHSFKELLYFLLCCLGRCVLERSQGFCSIERCFPLVKMQIKHVNPVYPRSPGN